LILHNNAGPLGTAASLHAPNASKPAGPAMPNVTLLEAPWANREPETDVCWPYPEIEDGYALPLEGPELGIEFNEELAAAKPSVPSLPSPRDVGR
jgi:L-alanine-DL-glutamate epimerase-like enolase superfamily enzyme